MPHLSIKLKMSTQTEKVGFTIGQLCPENIVIYLIGPLGAGKTTLSRGVLNALGYQGTVKSPTYSLIEPYELANQTIIHADFYRLHEPEEIHLLGIDEFQAKPCIWLIEWPEHVKAALPKPDLTLTLEPKLSYHELSWVSFSPTGEQIAQKLNQMAVS